MFLKVKKFEKQDLDSYLKDYNKKKYCKTKILFFQIFHIFFLEQTGV